jgi:hypothetical protein
VLSFLNAIIDTVLLLSSCDSLVSSRTELQSSFSFVGHNHIWTVASNTNTHGPILILYMVWYGYTR